MTRTLPHQRRRKHRSTAIIAIRLTVGERATLRRVAGERGVSVSDLIREALQARGILETTEGA